MEEEKYTAYDLESSQDQDCGGRESSAPYGEAVEEGASGGQESSASNGKAETELTRMVEEMGAEKVLEIIKGNRNSAIEQIISEMEQQTDRIIPSGASSSPSFSSIFDLASMA